MKTYSKLLLTALPRVCAGLYVVAQVSTTVPSTCADEPVFELVAWGANTFGNFNEYAGQATVPIGLSNVVMVAAGSGA